MSVTEVVSVTDELLAKVDEFLADIKDQKLVDQNKVVDFGLDLRLILQPSDGLEKVATRKVVTV